MIKKMNFQAKKNQKFFMTEWQNGRKSGRMAEKFAEWQKNWQNGRKSGRMVEKVAE